MKAGFRIEKKGEILLHASSMQPLARLCTVRLEADGRLEGAVEELYVVASGGNHRGRGNRKEGEEEREIQNKN